jgi:hypothetical protein
MHVALAEPQRIGNRTIATNRLAQARRMKVNEVKIEAVRRINGQLPAIKNYDSVQLMATLWPMMNTNNASAQVKMASSIYTFAKNTAVPWINTQTNLQTLINLDVRNHPGWPDD